MTGYRAPDPLAVANKRIEELTRSIEIEQKSKRRAEEERNSLESRFEDLRQRYNKLRVRENPLSQLMSRYSDEIIGGLFVALVLVIGAWVCIRHNRAENMHQGFVVAREHHQAYTTQVCHTSGKITTCTPVHHPERWSVTLADGQHEERVEYLRREEWLQHEPGTWMCLIPNDCSPPRDDAR